jgi:hypothetical protein
MNCDREFFVSTITDFSYMINIATMHDGMLLIKLPGSITGHEHIKISDALLSPSLLVLWQTEALFSDYAE